VPIDQKDRGNPVFFCVRDDRRTALNEGTVAYQVESRCMEVRSTRGPSLVRRVVLLTAAVLFVCAQVVSALSSYAPVPQGTVGLTRPPITQQITLARGEEIVRAQMWLDGVRVQPTWDSTGLVRYTPPAPLTVGVHSVNLSVEVQPSNPSLFYNPVLSEFTFRVMAGAVDQLPVAGPEELRALERVNQARVAAGLGALVYSDALGAAAVAHARYLVANPDQRTRDPHHEAAGTPLYFGASTGDRSRYYAFDGGVGEVINFAQRAEEAVDGWMETIYHRIPLLHPGSTSAGYGLAGDAGGTVNVLEVGSTGAGAGTAAWPYPGQTGVPTEWDGAETPDPFDLYPGVARPVGYSITLTFGGVLRGLTLGTATLTGPAGAVSVLRFHPGNDSRLDDTVAMIPVSPLAPGTTYSVVFAGTVDAGDGPQAYDRRWYFTTAAQRPVMTKSRTVTGLSDGTVRGIEVEGTGFSRGLSVFLGGLPVAGLQVASSTRISFKPPVGFTGGEADLVVVGTGGAEAVWTRFLTVEDAFRFPAAGSAFTAVPLLVQGVTLSAPALVDGAGTVLLPSQALATLGGRLIRVAEIERSFWRTGARSGDYTLGRTMATVQGAEFNLALPVRRHGGSTYVDAEFVRRLAGVDVRAGTDHVTVGVAVEGMYDIAAHWARDSVVRLLQAGIVSGYGDGSFRPDAPLTRAAFVKMLVGAQGTAVRPGDSGGFADTRGHWVTQQGYLGAAVRSGLVVASEYPGGQFEPDRAISREEISVMQTRALGMDAQAAVRRIALVGGRVTLAGKVFTDAGVWTRAGYTATAIEQGIVTGYEEADGTYTFRPTRMATRAEAAVMTVRMLDH